MEVPLDMNEYVQREKASQPPSVGRQSAKLVSVAITVTRTDVICPPPPYSVLRCLALLEIPHCLLVVASHEKLIRAVCTPCYRIDSAPIAVDGNIPVPIDRVGDEADGTIAQQE